MYKGRRGIKCLRRKRFRKGEREGVKGKKGESEGEGTEDEKGNVYKEKKGG